MEANVIRYEGSDKVVAVIVAFMPSENEALTNVGAGLCKRVR